MAKFIFWLQIGWETSLPNLFVLQWTQIKQWPEKLRCPKWLKKHHYPIKSQSNNGWKIFTAQQVNVSNGRKIFATQLIQFISMAEKPSLPKITSTAMAEKSSLPNQPKLGNTPTTKSQNPFCQKIISLIYLF